MQPLKWNSKAPAITETISQGGNSSDVWTWVGIRREESRARSHAAETEIESAGNNVYRPLVDWSKQQCFDLLKHHGVKPNPLYKLGCGRVGCMFCIYATKDEICEASKEIRDALTMLADAPMPETDGAEAPEAEENGTDEE